MPESKNGVQGEAFYVDTEGSFSCERLSEMAQGMLKAVEEPRNASNNVCEQSAVCNERVRTGDCTSCMTEMDVGMHCKSDSPTSIDSILQGVHYYRCLNLTQLLTIANILQEFLTNHRKVVILFHA